VAEFVGYVGFLPAEVAGPAAARLVEVPGGPTVACALPAGARGRGVLAIRPARVRLGPAGAGLPARVVARAYRGEFFEYRLRVGPHEFPATAPVGVAEGEAIGVTLEAARFFPDS
jgi:hypothetical protein